jgi:hypothetical protein
MCQSWYSELSPLGQPARICEVIFDDCRSWAHEGVWCGCFFNLKLPAQFIYLVKKKRKQKKRLVGLSDKLANFFCVFSALFFHVSF